MIYPMSDPTNSDGPGRVSSAAGSSDSGGLVVVFPFLRAGVLLRGGAASNKKTAEKAPDRPPTT
nr:hypothetical protein Q903MT_gene806 [Picea sitchensis]